MAAPDTPLVVTKNSQEALKIFLSECVAAFNAGFNIRSMLERMDRAYMREFDKTQAQQRAKLANAMGDVSRYQNPAVPLVFAAIENAVTYQTSVFLQGTPIFGMVSSAQYQDAAMQMQTVIEDQQIRGGWIDELIQAFRNGFKYNLLAVEVPYTKRKVASLTSTIKAPSDQATETVWEGTELRNLDLYNTFWDTRVAPSKVATQGEFAGYSELISRIALKKWFSDTPNHITGNVADAFKAPEPSLGVGNAPAGISIQGIYIPRINESVVSPNNSGRSNSPNWVSWINASKTQPTLDYKNVYVKTTLYARIIPEDFGLRVPSRNTPQVWKLVFINFSVLVLIERCTNVHEFLPVIFAQPYNDTLSYQTKSLGENMQPIQDLASSMWFSIIEARRRAIFDRGLYDPSRIASHHINSRNPSANIPVRPSALGKPIADAYHPIPFRDDQSGIILQETPQVIAMGEMISGQNRARQGQFVKGNKTQHEFDTVMSNSNGRDQLVSMSLEVQLFTPIKTIVKYNILQYQPPVELFNRQTENTVKIDPVQMRTAAMEFKVSDGLIPSDKLISADALTVAMQTISSSPQLSQEYNLAPLFSYFVKLRGGRIQEFEKSPEQRAYEQAVSAWQQTVLQMTKLNPQIQPNQFPPQPTPEQFNYQPNPNPAAQQLGGPVVTNHVNNIVNNVTQGQPQS